MTKLSNVFNMREEYSYFQQKRTGRTANDAVRARSLQEGISMAIQGKVREARL